MNSQLYKKVIETKITELTKDLNQIGYYEEASDNWEALPEEKVTDTEADTNTNADQVEAWNERRSILEELEKEYRSYKRALKKIEIGNYGLCEISGQEIEEARLKVKPDARTCIAHMEEEANLPL